MITPLKEAFSEFVSARKFALNDFIGREKWHFVHAGI